MWTNALYVVCFLCGVTLGWLIHIPTLTSTLDSHKVTQQQTTTHTVVTKPDGTTQVSDTETVNHVVADIPVAAPTPMPDWSVGVRHPLSPEFQAPRLGVEVGRRLIGDLWGTAGWSQAEGTMLGVRWEW